VVKPQAQARPQNTPSQQAPQQQEPGRSRSGAASNIRKICSFMVPLRSCRGGNAPPGARLPHVRCPAPPRRARHAICPGDLDDNCYRQHRHKAMHQRRIQARAHRTSAEATADAPRQAVARDKSVHGGLDLGRQADQR
jgi:hypothetical protein